MIIKDYFNKLRKLFSSKSSTQTIKNPTGDSSALTKADVLQKEVQRLNAIIATQSLLTKAKFEKEAFINLVVQQMLILTPASGAVVELAEGDDMVYKAATGVLAAYIGLRLKRELLIQLRVLVAISS